jgi:outer membrane lipoprotein-sorting protein
LNIKESSKGQVFYMKTSGQMLWIYQEPKDKQKKFYINGNKLIYYSIIDKTAFVNECYDKDTLSSSVTFLLGKGRLAEHFLVTKTDDDLPNKTLAWITLTPKEKNSPMKKIFLGINKSNKVEESIVEDPSGGKNHFKFSGFVKNKKFDKKIFIFTPPKGVSLQKMPNSACEPLKEAPAKQNKK